MAEGFDALRFAGYVRSRWKTVVIACVVASGLAAVVSLLLPRRYTAVSAILIGAPAGVDPRGATNVSPVYLESLRTYEHLASSDSLFLKALEHLNLRQQYSESTIESLKRRVLNVSKPLNTRIIEIAATLEDPKQAQALAQYIAEQTVLLSRSLDTQLSEDVAREAKANYDAATVRLAAAQKASDQTGKPPGLEGLRADLEGSRDLKFRVERDIGAARAELADLGTQPGAPSGYDRTEWVSRQVASVKARIASLETQNEALDRAIAGKDAELERLTRRHDELDAELLAARKDVESARAKMEDVRAGAAFRNERLDVYDPGIVPQRPSSPNIALNIVAALLISGVASVGYLAFRYGYDGTVA